MSADRAYADYIVRQRNEVRRSREMERRSIPNWLKYAEIPGLSNEAGGSREVHTRHLRAGDPARGRRPRT